MSLASGPDAETPQSRPDAVAATMRGRILRGDYRPGDRLPGERDIASELRVGRAAVREAMCVLEQLGLVAIRQGGGATVRALDEASFAVVPHLLFRDGELDLEIAVQVLDVHEMLVVGAARLAVERGGDAELVHAHDLLARLRRPDARAEERVETIEALFQLVARASGNLVLQLCRQAIGPDLMHRVGRFLWGALRPPADVLDSQIDALDRALTARDPAATEEAVRAFLRDRRRRLLDALAEREPDFTAPTP